MWNSLLRVCAEYVRACIKFQEFSKPSGLHVFVVLMSSLKSETEHNGQIGRHVRTLISHWANGGTPASCPPIPACFLFGKPGDFSPAGVEVYARERDF